MPRAFASDCDVVVAYEEVVLRAVRCFASRIVGEDDGDGRVLERGHPLRPFAEPSDYSVDAVAQGVLHYVRRELVGVLHVPDLPGMPGVHEVEHAREAVPPSDVAYCKRDYDILRLHGG